MMFERLPVRNIAGKVAVGCTCGVEARGGAARGRAIDPVSGGPMRGGTALPGAACPCYRPGRTLGDAGGWTGDGTGPHPLAPLPRRAGCGGTDAGKAGSRRAGGEGPSGEGGIATGGLESCRVDAGSQRRGRGAAPLPAHGGVPAPARRGVQEPVCPSRGRLGARGAGRAGRPPPPLRPRVPVRARPFPGSPGERTRRARPGAEAGREHRAVLHVASLRHWLARAG